MDIIASLKVRNNLNKSPLYTAIENTEISNKSHKNYIECEKNESFESTSLYDNTTFEPPNEFLMNKIVQQVEYLFSDVNILKDKFLLKHIKRNKEGYVSLKLISSLRKVKALTKDWRVVAYSLQKSQKLEINDEMTKIRRKQPLPVLKLFDASRTVLVFHYLPSCWSLDSLKKQLKMMGTVIFLEVVNSKEDIWYTRVQKTLTFYEKIATLPFAIVIFETPDEAANAVLQTSHPSSIVLKMVPLLEDGDNKKTPSININEYPFRNSEFSVQGSFVDNRFVNMTYETDEFCSGIPNFFPSITTDQCIFYRNGKRFDQSQGDVQSECREKENPLLTYSYKGDGPINNTGYQRKSCSRNHRETRVITLRQPRGPDGTKGFCKPGDKKRSPDSKMCMLY